MTHWQDTAPFTEEENLRRILDSDAKHRQERDILPARDDIFKSFWKTPLDKTRVVFLGQDPYPRKEHAMGLAFSVPRSVKNLPSSLINILRELKEDIGIETTSGDLTPWTRQGVMLLNTALTVEAGKPGSLLSLWKDWMKSVIDVLLNHDCVFVLMGKSAAGWEVPDALAIKTPHPSPLSAHKGFFGSRIFSTVNNKLKHSGHRPIDWSLNGI